MTVHDRTRTRLQRTGIPFPFPRVYFALMISFQFYVQFQSNPIRDVLYRLYRYSGAMPSHHAVLHVAVVAAVEVGVGGPSSVGRCCFRENLVISQSHTGHSGDACCLCGQTTLHAVGGEVPVWRGSTGRSAEVKPRLAVGTGSVVSYPSVGGHCLSELTGVTASTARSAGTTGTSVGMAGTRAVAVTSGRHVVVAVLDVRTLRAVNLGKSVDVLQLRSAEVSLVAADLGSSASESTATSSTSASTTSTSAAVAVLRERRVFTSELRLDTLAVRRVADGRENGSDRLDELDVRRLLYTWLSHSRAIAGSRRSSQGWSE